MRKNAVLITWEGKTLLLTEWSKLVGLPRNVLYSRFVPLRWSAKRTLTEPLKGTKPRLCPVTRRRGIRALRRASDLCPNCGKPRGNGKGMCDACMLTHKNYRRSHPEIYKGAHKRHNAKLKLSVFSVYGMACTCCGEDCLDFLTIDHVNNDGAKHRKEVGGGSSLYRWLVKNKFPRDGFEAMCFNCNLGRRVAGGVCPHQAGKAHVPHRR